jgi:hypothetical protein
MQDDPEIRGLPRCGVDADFDDGHGEPGAGADPEFPGGQPGSRLQRAESRGGIRLDTEGPGGAAVLLVAEGRARGRARTGAEGERDRSAAGDAPDPAVSEEGAIQAHRTVRQCFATKYSVADLEVVPRFGGATGKEILPRFGGTDFRIIGIGNESCFQDHSWIGYVRAWIQFDSGPYVLALGYNPERETYV